MPPSSQAPATVVAVSGSPLSGPNGHLRVGTAQREQALEVLRNAAADERISFDELEGRVPRALHATTRDDLAAVLADLLPTERVEEIVGGEPPLGEGPGYSWEDPLILESERWTELAVVGPWVVPPFLEVQTSIGGVRLDFTQATARSKVIDVVLMINDWGTATIVVPEGWGVDTEGVKVDNGQTAGLNSSVRTRPERGMPRLILRGNFAGSVVVRHPRWADRRALTKWERLGRPAPALALPPGPVGSGHV